MHPVNTCYTRAMANCDITVEDMRDDYDWREAWEFAGSPAPCEGSDVSCAPFGIADLERVIAADPGENDGESWVAIAVLGDGRFAYLEAWCDYTGWDCQSDGQVWVSDSLDNLWRFGVTDEGRMRLASADPVNIN